MYVSWSEFIYWSGTCDSDKCPRHFRSPQLFKLFIIPIFPWHLNFIICNTDISSCMSARLQSNIYDIKLCHITRKFPPVCLQFRHWSLYSCKVCRHVNVAMCSCLIYISTVPFSSYLGCNCFKQFQGTLIKNVYFHYVLMKIIRMCKSIAAIWFFNLSKSILVHKYPKSVGKHRLS